MSDATKWADLTSAEKKQADHDRWAKESWDAAVKADAAERKERDAVAAELGKKGKK